MKVQSTDGRLTAAAARWTGRALSLKPFFMCLIMSFVRESLNAFLAETSVFRSMMSAWYLTCWDFGGNENDGETIRTCSTHRRRPQSFYCNSGNFSHKGHELFARSAYYWNIGRLKPESRKPPSILRWSRMQHCQWIEFKSIDEMWIYSSHSIRVLIRRFDVRSWPKQRS